MHYNIKSIEINVGCSSRFLILFVFVFVCVCTHIYIVFVRVHIFLGLKHHVIDENKVQAHASPGVYNWYIALNRKRDALQIKGHIM